MMQCDSIQSNAGVMGPIADASPSGVVRCSGSRRDASGRLFTSAVAYIVPHKFFCDMCVGARSFAARRACLRALQDSRERT